MKITVEGDAKEIAALVLELQEQQTLKDLKLSVTNRLQAAIDRNEDVLYADDKPLTEQTQAEDDKKEVYSIQEVEEDIDTLEFWCKYLEDEVKKMKIWLVFRWAVFGVVIVFLLTVYKRNNG